MLHCVDLGESFPTHIFLQNLASIQTRMKPVKLSRSPRTDRPGYSICALHRVPHSYEFARFFSQSAIHKNIHESEEHRFTHNRREVLSQEALGATFNRIGESLLPFHCLPTQLIRHLSLDGIIRVLDFASALVGSTQRSSV